MGHISVQFYLIICESNEFICCGGGIQEVSTKKEKVSIVDWINRLEIERHYLFFKYKQTLKIGVCERVQIILLRQEEIALPFDKSIYPCVSHFHPFHHHTEPNRIL